MTALCVRNLAGLSYWTSALLFLILIQMCTSLLVFGGVFISSGDTVISPFHLCLVDLGEEICHVRPISGVGAFIVLFCLYVPLVLVAFALLSAVFAACSRDGLLLSVSAALQAASGVLTLTGVVAFAALNLSHLSWGHATAWFYVCSAVPFELAAVVGLTRLGPRGQTGEPPGCGDASNLVRRDWFVSV